ncbi:hypothetical protein AURDEDRAFT_161680 [Auricularia subglabra TFB-10046 SS5]|nr:hypothetical protein AURDEDRAFT_161680 [Auricularia subglabra TFB-10046 SS5]
MANADCLHRLYVSAAGSRHDKSSFWKYLKVLRSPSEQMKFTASSGPGFRRMNDVSTHITWGLILECWVLEAHEWNASCSSLEMFAKRLSTLLRSRAWETIMALSKKIAMRYIADGNFFASHSKPTDERNQVFENWSLYLQHSLMDQVLSYAIKTQDVGCVVLSLYDWMFVYHAAKKHKYAYHTLRTLSNIAHVFPKHFSHAFLMSWIINPSGKAQGGRGVDWLVELYNLYLKTVHCGSSSNYGLERMLKLSTLISLFKVVFDNFVMHYRVMTHNVHHAEPDMAETLRRLRNEISEDDALVFTAGRTSPFVYADALADGHAGFMEGSVGKLALSEQIDIILQAEIDDFFGMDTELD